MLIFLVVMFLIVRFLFFFLIIVTFLKKKNASRFLSKNYLLSFPFLLIFWFGVHFLHQYLNDTNEDFLQCHEFFSSEKMWSREDKFFLDHWILWLKNGVFWKQNSLQKKKKESYSLKCTSSSKNCLYSGSCSCSGVNVGKTFIYIKRNIIFIEFDFNFNFIIFSIK